MLCVLSLPLVLQYLDSKAYEDELRRYEANQRAELQEARLKAQKAVSYSSVCCSVRLEHTRLFWGGQTCQHPDYTLSVNMVTEHGSCRWSFSAPGSVRIGTAGKLNCVLVFSDGVSAFNVSHGGHRRW